MKRALSLLPSATEIIYELGAERFLVGVTHECDYPEAARGKPRVTGAMITADMASDEIDRLVRQQLEDTGSLYTLDMDLVRELRPEIVLTQQLCTVCAVGYATVRAAMRTLEEPPLVINLEPKNLEDVMGTILEVGELLGVPEVAAERVAGLRGRLHAIAPLEPAPRVLFLEWLIPPFSAGHWMGQLVEAAGAVPVLANIGEHSRQLTWEAIADAELDVVVISCCGFSAERAMRDVRSCRQLHELLRSRPELRLIVFDGNHFFSRPGPRLVESAELLHGALAGVAAESARSTIAEPYIHVDIARLLSSISAEPS